MFRSKFIFSAIEVILPYLLAVTYILLMVETVSYIGFLRQFIFVDSLFFYFLSCASFIFLTVWLSIHQTKKVAPITMLFLRLQSFFLLPMLIVYYIFYLLEKMNYPNYVFSSFHVQPDIAVYVLMLNFWSSLFYIFLLLYRKKVVTHFTLKPGTKTISLFSLNLLLFILLLVFGVTNGISTLGNSLENVSLVFKHLDFSYDQKMRVTWGFFYDQMMFVKKMSPETATVALPPAQSHWLSDGNSVLVRYFLFPRKVVNVTETSSNETLYQMPTEKYQYVLLSKGEWNDPEVEFGWPKVRFAAKRIYYLNTDLSVVSFETLFFDPTLEQNKSSYGLIEL